MNTLKEYIQENLVITNKEAEELGYIRINKNRTIRNIKNMTISTKRKSNR